MIFESLFDSAKAGELLLIGGGYCRWHKRRDNTITIYEIISLRAGAGSEILAKLKVYGLPITAKCPCDLESNAWYERRGFALLRTDTLPGG